MDDDQFTWVTLPEAAEAGGVSRSTLRAWYRDGKLPSRLEPGPHGFQRLVPRELVIERALRSGRLLRQGETVDAPVTAAPQDALVRLFEMVVGQAAERERRLEERLERAETRHHGAIIPILQLDPDLPAPIYAHPGDAGADLRAREDAVLEPGGGRVAIPTGIAVAIPDGYAGFVLPRSGLAFKHGVTCLNTPGLVDSGFRGEVKVILVNTDPTEPYKVRRGDRIAQLVIQPVERAEFPTVDSLPESMRGPGGFGSTGSA